MFTVRGQSGSISAIVGTTSLRKAVMHLNRMEQAGLRAIIIDEQGCVCRPHSDPAGCTSRRASVQ